MTTREIRNQQHAAAKLMLEAAAELDRLTETMFEFAEWFHRYKHGCYKGPLQGYLDDRSAKELFEVFKNKNTKK